MNFQSAISDYLVAIAGCVLLAAAVVLAVRQYNAALVGLFLGTGFLLIVFNLSFDTLIYKPLGLEIRKNVRRELTDQLAEIERKLADHNIDIITIKKDIANFPADTSGVRKTTSLDSKSVDKAVDASEFEHNKKFRVIIFYSPSRKAEAQALRDRFLSHGFRSSALENDDNFWEFTDVIKKQDRKAGTIHIGHGDESAQAVLGTIEQITRNALPESTRDLAKVHSSQWTDVKGSDINILLY